MLLLNAEASVCDGAGLENPPVAAQAGIFNPKWG